MTKCKACEVYQATVWLKVGKIDIEICHSCLVHLRAEAKIAFKVSEAKRAISRGDREGMVR